MKGLILLDWDATLTDEEGHFNDSHLQEIIQAKIAQGWSLGLNSDTPLRRLRGWWQALHLNGPIVAEKGAVIWWPGGRERILSQTASLFAAFRQKVILALTHREGCALFFGDSTQFIGSVNRMVSNDTLLVALDAYLSIVR